MLSLIFLIMLGITLYRVIQHAISVPLALAGLLGGLLVGLGASRMYHLSWDEEALKVVSRLDQVGAVILALYIVFSLARNWLFGHWVHGAALGALTLTITGGAMLGRVWGMGYGIRRLLQAWGVVGEKPAP